MTILCRVVSRVSVNIRPQSINVNTQEVDYTTAKVDLIVHHNPFSISILPWQFIWHGPTLLSNSLSTMLSEAVKLDTKKRRSLLGFNKAQSLGILHLASAISSGSSVPALSSHLVTLSICPQCRAVMATQFSLASIYLVSTNSSPFLSLAWFHLSPPLHHCPFLTWIFPLWLVHFVVIMNVVMLHRCGSPLTGLQHLWFSRTWCVRREWFPRLTSKNSLDGLAFSEIGTYLPGWKKSKCSISVVQFVYFCHNFAEKS